MKIAKPRTDTSQDINDKSDLYSNQGNFSSWYQRNKDWWLVKLMKIILIFIISLFCLYLFEVKWLSKHSFYVNADNDTLSKMACIIGFSIIILVVFVIVFRVNVKMLFVVVCSSMLLHILLYYTHSLHENRYVNARTGDIYFTARDAVKNDSKSNRKYFIHPLSGDTCWNDFSENVMKNEKPDVNQSVQSTYDPPTQVITYSVRKKPYTFKLKAGETLNHWITLAPQTRNIHFEIFSPDYDYYMIYSETEQYHDNPNLVIPDRDSAKFYFKAGKTDQVITMKLSYY